MTTLRRYGWIPDRPSSVPWFNHERLLSRRTAPLPEFTQNRRFIFWVYDQGSEGSCTANSAVSTIRYIRSVQGLADFDGSRQALYHMTLGLSGDTSHDRGASIADTVQAESLYGVPCESLWKYGEHLFSEAPTAEVLADALRHQVITREPVVQSQEAIEAILAAGQPLHFGMSIFASFESDETAKTGIVRRPRLLERELGGHALWLFDFNRPRRKLYGQNSWGKTFGQDGYGIFEIDYDYVFDSDRAADFWTISKVEVEGEYEGK